MSKNPLEALLSDKQFEKLFFTANEPVKMIITEVKEKEKGISLKCSVENGEHAGKMHFIYSNYYMRTKKSDTLLLNPTLSALVRALLMDEAAEAVKSLGSDADKEAQYKAIIQCLFENIDEKIIGRAIEVVFKPKDGEWQNIKEITDLGFEGAEETKVNEKDVEF